MIDYCIPTIRTATFDIPISEYLHLAELKLGSMNIYLPSTVTGATARVTERLLAHYWRFRTSTRLLQSFPNIY